MYRTDEFEMLIESLMQLSHAQTTWCEQLPSIVQVLE